MTNLILALLVIDMLHSLQGVLIAFAIMFMISILVHGWLYFTELDGGYRGDAFMNAMLRRFKYSMLGLSVVAFLFLPNRLCRLH